MSDAELKLYDEMLGSDFLHYAYFDNPAIDPADISLNQIIRGQKKYAEIIMEQIENKDAPVFDIGCGMGGITGMLLANGYETYSLTPDKNQVKYIKKKYKNTQLLHQRFEQLNADKYLGKFGTLITSESFQYIKPEIAMQIIDKILAVDGKWILTDYFRIGEAAEKSGHFLENFTELLTKHGYEIEYERDITIHILPTIAYAYMWGTRIGTPIFRYICGKMKVKTPGLFHLLADAIPELERLIDKELAVVNPAVFSKSKKYILLTIKRKK